MVAQIDIEALSGILGSVSIACWVVVFTPQIVENFRRSSTEGLSLLFIVIWLLGDAFNIVGAVLQNVLPTMVILAVYYTVADIVLLGQCLWYQRRSLKEVGVKRRIEDAGEESAIEEDSAPTERSPLLSGQRPDHISHTRPRISDAGSPLRGSFSSQHSRLSSGVDATRLSPATPFITAAQPTSTPPAAQTLKPKSALSAFLFNICSLLLVCGIGVLGWWLTARSPLARNHTEDPRFSLLSLQPFKASSSSDTQETSPLHIDLLGQIFGYLSAALYLGSRVPQLLLNYRRKSTDGVSLLFFLFACVGNLTYVLSILAYEPSCAKLEAVQGLHVGKRSADSACGEGEWNAGYRRYILVNASWLIGSAGTLILDLCVFIQFWMYRHNAPHGGTENAIAS